MNVRIRISEGTTGYVATLLGPRWPRVGHEGWKVTDLAHDHVILQLANPHYPEVSRGLILHANDAMTELEVSLGEYNHPACRGL